MKPARKPPRNAEIAMIKMGVKQLGMDEETERLMYFSCTGLRHASEMDHAQRARVIAHLKACGARIGRAGPAKPAKDRQGLLDKITAQLVSLKLPETYAEGIARRMFGVERLAFCAPSMLVKIVAALTYRQQKKGVPTE